MTLMVERIKDNLVPYSSNIDHAQEMYEALTKLFTIKNIGQVASLKNELRTTKMTKDDTVASLFVRISRIRDEIQAIDEILLEKELVITALLGLPPTWSSFASGFNSWKEASNFEQLWNAYTKEEMRISLVYNNEEEKVSNAYSASHKKGYTKKSRAPRNKVDISKIEC